MPELTFLTAIEDERKGNTLCQFNGYLEDYLETLEEGAPKDTLKKIHELNPDFRVIVNYRFNIQADAVTNQIIRYKDITKLPSHPFVLPMLVYGNDAQNEALGFILDEEGQSYTLLKGLYYAITEAGALLDQLKNNIVVAILTEDTLPVLTELFNRKLRCGAAQRQIDAKYFSSLDDLKAKITAEAAALQEAVKAEIVDHKHKAPVIYNAVTSWFLMKKVLYVQTMMNRQLLEKECEGDVKKQRHQAKLNADAVTFLAYSEMWRLN